MGVSKTSDHIQIDIWLQNPSKEPPASSKPQNQDLKIMNILRSLKGKIESQNSKYGCTKELQLYPNKEQNAKPQTETASIHQSVKSGLEGH